MREKIYRLYERKMLGKDITLLGCYNDKFIINTKTLFLYIM